jgi:hypothetical protein
MVKLFLPLQTDTLSIIFKTEVSKRKILHLRYEDNQFNYLCNHKCCSVRHANQTHK